MAFCFEINELVPDRMGDTLEATMREQSYIGQQGEFDAIGRIVDNLHMSAVPSLGEL